LVNHPTGTYVGHYTTRLYGWHGSDYQPRSSQRGRRADSRPYRAIPARHNTTRPGRAAQRYPVNASVSRRSFLQTTLLVPSALLSPAGPCADRAVTRFKLGIIADEIADDLAQALNFIAAHSLGYCELREIWQKNIMSLTAVELGRVKRLLDQYRLRVSAIASPIFKYHLPEMPAHPENPLLFHSTFSDRDSAWLLRRAFEIAHLLGTFKVRVFSFWRTAEPGKAYPYVRDRLARAAELAAQNGMTLALENEYDTNVATAGELGRMLRDIGSRHLRANWDPGNDAIMNEVPYPDGYRQLEGLIAHVHIKDVRRSPQSSQLTWAPVGSGLIDWTGQLRALADEGYQGTMSLETHYRPNGDALRNAQESLAGLMRIVREIG
jgi:sugar phosphate isomerase/epimerase